MDKRIVIAIDSFKGSLSSREAGEAAARGVRAALPDYEPEVFVMADGGEGTVEALVSACGGDIVTVVVNDPLGRPVPAYYGICREFTVVEVAAASGLTLLAPEERNPSLTDSFGTGQLIMDAISRGSRNFIIGLGGSATNDGGVGMLRALGYRFLDAEGHEVVGGGGVVGSIRDVDDTRVDPILKECRFTLASDVLNPLCGRCGASRLFARQKGAPYAYTSILDAQLRRFSAYVECYLGAEFSEVPGAGAAGGLGYAFIAFLNAEVRRGAELVLDLVGIDSRLDGASLVITGEGMLDRTTLIGKAPFGVLTRAKDKGISVVAIGGSVDAEAEPLLYEAGFKGVFPIVDGPCTLEKAMIPYVAASNIERTVKRVLRVAGLGL